MTDNFLLEMRVKEVIKISNLFKKDLYNLIKKDSYKMANHTHLCSKFYIGYSTLRLVSEALSKHDR